MRLHEPLTPEASYELGKELFELWVNLGTVSKMNREYKRRHPDKEWVQDGVQARRAKNWWVENCDEGIEIIKNHNPSIPEFVIQERLLGYALAIFQKKGKFLDWVEKNPWAKQYESAYSELYGK